MSWTAASDAQPALVDPETVSPKVDSAAGETGKANVLAELAAAWKPLAACTIGVFLGTLPSYSIGAFLEPVSRDLRISLTEVLGWSMCWSIGIVAAAPFAGYLADRFGARRLAIVAILSLAAVLGWAAIGIGGLASWYASGLAIGAICAGVGGITFGRIVSVSFERGLGTALGLMSTGVGVAAVIGPRAMQAIIDAHGWRIALAVEAAMVVAALPLLARWLGNPDFRGGSTAPVEGETLREAIRRPVFWLLALGTLFYGVCVAGVSVNLMPYLAAQGMDRAAAASALGLFGVATIAGRMLTGIVIDKAPLHASTIIALLLVAEAAAFMSLALVGASALIPVLVVFGFAVGAEGDCLAYLVARFFGRRHFSSIFGMLGIATLYIGTGIGPAAYNITREAMGSYPSALIVWAGMALLSAAAFLATLKTSFFGAASRNHPTTNN